MFPIPWNFPFRKKNGDVTTLDAAISSGGGGGYELPTATASRLGGVKIGSGVNVSNDGTISVSGGGSPYELPTASAETKGGVKIGSGLSMDGETLNNSNPTPYELPTASVETLGGIKVGSGLTMDNGVLNNAIGNYNVNISLTNVNANESELKAFKTNRVVTFGGMIELNNDLNVGGNVRISSAGIPSDLRESPYCPMFVTATDSTASKFVPAVLVIYSTGNISIYNTASDIAIRYIWVNCSYRLTS